MASFTHIELLAQPAGAARAAYAADTLRGYHAAQALDRVIAGLAVIGSPVRRLAGQVLQGLQAWSAARRRNEEDRRLWDLAQSDTRIMAELSRAMNQQEALKDGSRFL